jgi:Competence protein CoiA-like family
VKSFEVQKIPFGIQNGVPVGIENVPSGLACNCFCPSCGGILQARKGMKNTPHFSHDPSANKMECRNALETSIHAMAKHIINEERTISFPELSISVSDVDSLGREQIESEVILSMQKIKISDAQIEQRFFDVRPDITVYVNEEPVLIEIAVTHFIDEIKKAKIREMNVRAVEINLSKVDYRISKSELREIIIESTKEKKWISYPDAI